MSPVEIFAVVTGAWSVWLLAKNRPLGWWVALASVAAFTVVFYRARLFGEVGIQIFYFVTCLQAIWIWIRGGESGGERPVSRVPRRVVLITIPIFLAAFYGLWLWLRTRDGAVPFWDALTTVTSLTAHLYLMWRYRESWWIWIAVDLIYVPLYASRGLYATSALYVVYLILSIMGLRNFNRLLASEEKSPAPESLPDRDASGTLEG